MSAVPSSSQLAVVLPAAATTVTQAELAQDTHNGISNVNTLLDDVLGLVDAVRVVRADEPDVQQPHLGPVRRFESPGLAVGARRHAPGERDDVRLPPATCRTRQAAAPAWVEFLTGTFDLAGGVKQGNGTVQAHFDALATAAFPLDRRLEAAHHADDQLPELPDAGLAGQRHPADRADARHQRRHLGPPSCTRS